MKYYISKPVSHKLDERIVSGIKEIDSESEFVETLQDADICVFQNGWTKSKVCVAEYHLARDKHIDRKEAHLFIDKYLVKLNRNQGD